MLQRLCPSLDFTKIDAERQKAYDVRTGINRRLRDAQGSLEGLQEPTAELPDAEVSVAELSEKLQGLMNQTELHAEWGREDDKFRADHGTTSTLLKQLEEDWTAYGVRIASVKKELAQIVEDGKNHQKLKPYLPPVEAVQKAQEEIVNSEATNLAIRDAVSYRAAATLVNKIALEAEALSEQIRTIDTTKDTAIANAEYPIEGLGIMEGSIVFNEIPLSQLASSEKIRVSTAIGMALNPEFKVLCVHDGSLLDADGLQAIETQTKDQDYQLWIEVVGEGGAGILIEEGQVKK